MPSIKEAAGHYLPLVIEIKKRAEELDYLEAVWIHGSRAAGKSTSSSDLDLTFLVKNETDKERLKDHIRDIIKWRRLPGFYPEMTWDIAEWHDEYNHFHDIGWHCFTTEEFKFNYQNIFNNDKVDHAGERWIEPYMDTKFLRNQGEVQFIVIESIALYDPKKILKNTKDRCSKYPKKFADSILWDFTDRLRKRLAWMDEGPQRNMYNFVSDIREVMYYIAIAHYAKNRKFMQNGLKRYHHDLKKFKPNLTKDLKELLKVDKEFGKQDKTKVLKRIIKKLESR